MTAKGSYDAIIVGTGQGGKPLAGALAEAGHNTAVIEKEDRVGGTCVLTGCTPTKTMIASARVAHLARRSGGYGVRTGDVSVDLKGALQYDLDGPGERPPELARGPDGGRVPSPSSYRGSCSALQEAASLGNQVNRSRYTGGERSAQADSR